MTFDEAKALSVEGNAEMRHPGLVRGVVIKEVEGKLFSVNPIINRWQPYTPTEEDLSRTDWTAGQGLAAI